MSQHNRQRRAAKQRHRAQQRRRNARPDPASTSAGLDEAVLGAGAATILLDRALLQFARHTGSTSELSDFRRCAQRHQQAAVDEQFTRAVDALIDSGWTPLDLHEAVRRKTAGTAVSHLLDVVAEATARHPAHLVHPQWRAQLDQLGAAAQRYGGVSPSGRWAARVGLDWVSALEHLLAVLVVTSSLPRLQQVLPPPGAVHAQSTTGVDAKVLRRVRGLLAKAESTDHPEEADALTAKAQQLMTRYSIERALAESAQPVTPQAVCRRLWVDSPYVDAKSLLVTAVADANNCRSVQSTVWGFVALVGHAADLDMVELLVTSLLLQATRAMTSAGPQATWYGTSRTRSFRQSFLVAYAYRIGEQLASSALDTEASYNSGSSGALLPVLAARRDRVDNRMAELFPGLVTRKVSSSNAAGWGAGRAAADLARLDVRDSIAPRAG